MSAPEPSTIDLVIDAPITRADVPGLCQRVRALLATSDAEIVVCDVGAITRPDAVTVDALARLALTVRQDGRDLRLRHVSDELHELIALIGLRGVVPRCVVLPFGRGGQTFGRRGQTEQREQRRRVEEEDDPDDLPG